ncbi:hypothetical protein NE237_018822 [Protea cynaroides]|uniref:BZIP domain-containing protein n=1 Tax=Protea cynaroides TaxID=273540 RepID=A0A9Q0QPD6_9MAGN|nr:hypothetical protein NE237_018822 [Protea cynaroides]
MRSSSDGEQHFITTTTNNNNRRVSSSSSNSSISSRSASLSTPTRKTMEEVWKDINLTSLSDHPSSRDGMLLSENNIRTVTDTAAAARSFGGMIFQDFLGRPFSKDPPLKIVSADPNRARERSPLTSPPSLPPPTTALSLNSVPQFRFLESIEPLRPPPQLNSPVNAPSPFFMSTPTSSPMDAFGSSPSFFPCFKKRVSDSDDGSGDRRHKRMIKNRESAARSRARKQESLALFSFVLQFCSFFVFQECSYCFIFWAYTNELEIELDHLRKENAMLRQELENQRKHEQGQGQSPFVRTAQLPKKQSLCRTSTAPF